MLAATAAGEAVALRTAGGRFLRVAKDGSLRAERRLPAEDETFELIPQGKDRVALRAPGGRLLATAGPDGRTLWAAGTAAKPGPRETFLLVPAGARGVGLKSSTGRWVRIEPGKPPPDAPPAAPAQRPPREATLEIFRTSAVPAAVQTALSAAVQGLVTQELEGKEYDKTRSKLKVREIELPAPTLRDPGRTKKHRLWATRHEYRVRARLDGRPRIRVTAMPYLKSYAGPDARLLVFSAEAEVPVAGRVGYRIPERVSAATNFRTTAALRVVGHVRVEKSADQLTLRPPEVVDLRIELRRLDISNDLLNAAADPIEDVINREVRHRHDRILRQANQSIRKAFDGREIRHPLLRHLGLP